MAAGGRRAAAQRSVRRPAVRALSARRAAGAASRRQHLRRVRRSAGGRVVSRQPPERRGRGRRRPLRPDSRRSGPPRTTRRPCAEMGVPAEGTALMGTAANMAYAACRSAAFDDLRVDAFVTAGVAGNAARAGDPARWMEGGDGRWRRVEDDGAGPRGPRGGAARRHDQHHPAARLPRHPGRPGAGGDHADRSEVGRPRGARRAQPVLAHRRHRDGHRPVLSRRPPRSAADAENRDRSRTPSSGS